MSFEHLNGPKVTIESYISNFPLTYTVKGIDGDGVTDEENPLPIYPSL